MARKRLAMELISNKKARLTCFEKRKKSLKKAAYELSALCGVDIGMIVCNDERNETEVWPPNHETVARMIKLYKLGSDQDWMYRTYGVSDYFKEKRERVKEQIKKMREKTREGKYAKWDDECDGFSQDQLREVGKFLKAKIGAVRENISLMKGGRSLFTESDVLMDSSVLKGRVFGPDIGKQQQHWTYFGTQDNMGNLEGSRNLCSETKFWVKPLMQESVSLMPDFVQEQQILAYNDTYNNLGGLVEGYRNPYLKSKFNTNPYLQESEIYMPEIVRHLAHYEARNSIGNQNEKMNSDGASCSRGICNFGGNQDNYAHFSNDSCFQNCGMQTEIMEKVGIS